MKRALPLLLGALLLSACAAPARDNYVPAGIWRDSRHEAFVKEWLGGPLRAMREPILSRPGDRGRFDRRLRLLVVPYRSPSYAIRIDESAGAARLSFVELDHGGRRTPRRVARRQVSELTAAEMSGIRDLVRQSGLASAPAWTEPRPPRITETEQIIETCVHATYYVFELVDGTGNRFIERDPCDISPALNALADRMIALRPDARWR